MARSRFAAGDPKPAERAATVWRQLTVEDGKHSNFLLLPLKLNESLLSYMIVS
jgi:hypothetical protein